MHWKTEGPEAAAPVNRVKGNWRRNMELLKELPDEIFDKMDSMIGTGQSIDKINSVIPSGKFNRVWDLIKLLIIGSFDRSIIFFFAKLFYFIAIDQIILRKRWKSQFR
jgi:hypothetical protein